MTLKNCTNSIVKLRSKRCRVERIILKINRPTKIVKAANNRKIRLLIKTLKIDHKSKENTTKTAPQTILIKKATMGELRFTLTILDMTYFYFEYGWVKKIKEWWLGIIFLTSPPR